MQGLKGIIYINEQEESGTYNFIGIPNYMTCGFKNIFKEDAEAIAFTALALLLEKYPNNADYFQTFKYIYPDGKAINFWCINDIDHITFLLPEEY